MTYKELCEKTKAIEKEEEKVCNACGRKILALREKYRKEHKPMDIEYNQRILVRLQVSRETVSKLSESEKRKRKYQIGYTYRIAGTFRGWWISATGQLRPCLYGVSYSQTDEILGIELSKEQPKRGHELCRCFNNGYCNVTGGSLKNKHNKIEEGSFVCPRYEEIIPEGVWERYPHGEIAPRHCPNVTKVNEKGKTHFRVWSLDWKYFTDYEEATMWKIYTRQKPL